MREMWLSDICSQPSDMTDEGWQMMANIVNPRWTEIPLFSDSELASLCSQADGDANGQK